MVTRIHDFRTKIIELEQLFSKYALNPGMAKDVYFIDLIKDLKNLLKDSQYADLADIINESEYFKKIEQKIRAVYDIYYVYLESDTVLEVLFQGKDVYKDFKSNNNLLGEREGDLASINQDSHVAFIGSGPFPWTSLVYNRIFNCRVTGLDSNASAIYLASRLIEKVNLKHKILFELTNAEKYDYSKFTHVSIAGMARPKNDIIKQIALTAKSGTKVTVRTAVGLHGFMYEKVYDYFVDVFDVIGRVSAGENSELESIILVKM
jgi:hypothetical protein